MLIRAFCFLCAGLLLAAAALPHKFYLSTYELRHNAETRQLEITARIFPDDLERALEEAGCPDMRQGVLGTKMEPAWADSCLLAYMQQRLQLKINDDEAKLRLLGKEIEGIDAAWVYLYVEDVRRVKRIEAYVPALTEVYPAQRNLLRWMDPQGGNQNLNLGGDKLRGVLVVE